MNVPRTGLLVALALAGGIAIGATGSTIAASPAPWAAAQSSAGVMSQMSQMMGGTNGAGMMGSGASFGTTMMGNLSAADRANLLARCDELHDAMHAELGASPAASGAPSLHDLHHAKP